jgi:hypothetical protein
MFEMAPDIKLTAKHNEVIEAINSVFENHEISRELPILAPWLPVSPNCREADLHNKQIINFVILRRIMLGSCASACQFQPRLYEAAAGSGR